MAQRKLNDTEALVDLPSARLPPEQVWAERLVDSKTGECRTAAGRWGCQPGLGASPDAGGESLRGACEALRG